ncbi:putative heavy metal-associated domain, HMA [Rosa chinensis]|uniref:Putative heavy metal-associated domain, HMA n=1 Tax=Rosa chinensis TaxID=74649 RepID=A0A2P6SDP1_ROSCH|nr:heavy metal-associated isoprenylated plant protein 4 [Rosa chinensis]PRQ56796.1 putative heavy metal-associated domain, HMA [Rosa chinensis]
MAAKEEAKEKDRKDDKAKDEKKAKEKDGVITAVYKVNLHCPQCAREIKKPLIATQGVHNVEVERDKGEIKVKGNFDPTKIQKRLQKLCKKKIELVSPKVQIKESITTEKKVVKETKEVAISRTTLVKVHMHCHKCEQDLKKKLLTNKGVHNVKTDMKAQTLAVEGTIDPEKLISYLRKKVHKHAEIIPPKQEKKDETKQKEKSSSKPPEKKEEKKEKEKESGKSTEIDTKVVDVKEEIKVVEVKTKEGSAPYFIHYVYAPQIFSDENPNACSIM